MLLPASPGYNRDIPAGLPVPQNNDSGTKGSAIHDEGVDEG
ncbi:hypothetical protein KNP414_05572 [Paenibacillus mucilaginosus KNP414]|uniref:Uncharacterized protein n=1 Tax=Paenibacillus mucilaginosus (strain KNP414) TaxID=1036673 RepID=F8FK55_PAEMK|nr:hypothetical protein KNP414_05572 [Paenibacillus mucilaginosus KNP414]